MNPFVLVSGDFVTTGGMDRANYALASYLARQGYAVHLVSHRAAPDLLARPAVYLHPVPKPAGSYFLGGFCLDHKGRRCAAAVRSQGGRVLVNGGNCQWGDVNWVHYVHAAYPPSDRGVGRSWVAHGRHRLFARQERTALQKARLVIANSEATRRHVIELVGVPPERAHTVYYGTDPAVFRPVSLEERAAAREALGWAVETPVVAFVGGLGDRRKGFDTLFAAWKQLCAKPSWDALLAVVGTGAKKAGWQQRAAEEGLTGRVHFLGFRSDVPRILAASEALVAPTRYEAYGLGVHEALCSGIPAFVTRSAGVAERYPPHLAGLLLDDPNDVEGLVKRLEDWRSRKEEYRTATLALAEQLRAITWDDMAGQVVRLVEASA